MIKKTLTFVIKLLVMVFLVLLFLYLFQSCRTIGYKIFSDQSKDDPESEYVVEASIHINEGESLFAIGEDLVNKKIVEDKWTFGLALRCMEGYKNIVPGDYIVNSGQKPSKILSIITKEEDSE